MSKLIQRIFHSHIQDLIIDCLETSPKSSGMLSIISLSFRYQSLFYSSIAPQKPSLMLVFMSDDGIPPMDCLFDMMLRQLVHKRRPPFESKKPLKGWKDYLFDKWKLD